MVAADRLARIRARLEALYDRLARGEGPTRGADGGFAVEASLERRARAWERSIAHTWRLTERRGASAPLAERRVQPRTHLARDAVLVHLWRHGDLVRGLVRIGARVGPGVDIGSFEDLEGLCLSLRIRAHRWAFLRERDPAATDPAAVERVLEQLSDLVLRPLGADRWPVDVRIAADPSLPDLRGRCSRSAGVGSARPAGCSACPPRTASPRRPTVIASSMASRRAGLDTGVISPYPVVVSVTKLK